MTLQVQLHRQFLLTFFHHSVNIFSTFFSFHPSFPLSHLQIYNYNCTIPVLQLQITFYNCRNCHQLRVKICPDKTILSSTNFKARVSYFMHSWQKRCNGFEPLRHTLRNPCLPPHPGPWLAAAGDNALKTIEWANQFPDPTTQTW